MGVFGMADGMCAAYGHGKDKDGGNKSEKKGFHRNSSTGKAQVGGIDCAYAAQHASARTESGDGQLLRIATDGLEQRVCHEVGIGKMEGVLLGL